CLHTSLKTIRGRLLSYFSQQMSVQGSNKITVPFDRQQLADYLNLDRSALSKELGKMKKDGLIEYRKNRFEIKIDI
ncbi:MAG: helix-turn-helix domain-containing protein, partial [Oscillospiraceae bacterium]|nr:helix-turn-helix domain-containing protein [Oscillospiraceae bacterium]